MSPPESSSTSNPVPPERLAEAGVWIARLHGDARGRAVEDGFRRWLQENPVNARAFELATEVWDDAENLRRFVPLTPRIRSRARLSPVLTWAAAAFGVALIALGLVLFQIRGVFATGVGEQRQLVLEDGTRVFLNTNTRIVVKYDEDTRHVELQQGEALFNVAKKPDWPFVVVAGERQVTALGTSFVVRRDEARVAVTLVEGKVVVAPSSEPTLVPSSFPGQGEASGGAGTSSAGASPRTPAEETSDPAPPPAEVFMLTPGQRLTFAPGEATQLDTPSVDKATAWRRGQVILDDTPLSAAAAEMNRYNSIKLVIERPEAGAVVVNGLFQAGDSIHFANAVAQTYGMQVIERGDEIVIVGVPTSH